MGAETSTTRGDPNPLAPSSRAPGDGDALCGPDIDPLSSIFGPGVDASSSKDEEGALVDAIVSNSSEVTSNEHTLSLNASCLEEANMESEDRVPPSGSPSNVDIGIVDVARGILNLGKNVLANFFSLVAFYTLGAFAKGSLLCRSIGCGSLDP